MFVLIMVIGLDGIVQCVVLQITLCNSYLWTSSSSTNHPHWPFTIHVGKVISIFFVENRKSSTNTARNKMTCFPIFQYFHWQSDSCWVHRYLPLIGFQPTCNQLRHPHLCSTKSDGLWKQFPEMISYRSTFPACSFFLRAWRYMLCLTVH